MNILKCNRCSVRNCSHWITKKVKDQYVSIPINMEDSSNCSSFKDFDTFKMPMLLHLSNNKNINNLNKLLTQYNIRLTEIQRPPFFRLILRGK